ncbi:hypothetical protein DDE83_005189 [Stemphylium lycopersici]|uniref:Uncharacterized protein n=1 Tax=Stemphylium lycopersici TaxID=183478 RepID=A0A364N2Z5_STELY|nr:hypothetical protein DDE83_005189 [Stemphylium lycopersici]
MASTAVASKKKRNRAKDRQRRKEKEQWEAGSDTSPDEELPPNAAYGPWKEIKRAWDARLEAQPVSNESWGAFQRCAKQRKGRPIEYQPPSIPADKTLHVHNSTPLDISGTPQQKIVFAPDFNVDDAYIDEMVKTDSKFRDMLRIFIAGDPERVKAIEISDAGVEKLLKGFPNLEIITLHGTRKLTRVAFPIILKSCPKIEAVTISVVKGQTSKRTRLNSTLDWLMDKDFVTKLRYLEFRGVYLSPGHYNFLEFLTKRRPALELVYEYGRKAVLIRDMESVPLSHVPAVGEASTSVARQELNDEEDWEEEYGSFGGMGGFDEFGGYNGDDISESLISADPRANARMLSLLGKQAAMSNALGRDTYDFEIDEDYGGYEKYDEGEIDPAQMRKMLGLMRQMGMGR